MTEGQWQQANEEWDAARERKREKRHAVRDLVNQIIGANPDLTDEQREQIASNPTNDFRWLSQHILAEYCTHGC
jgi:hypothetical protein